MRQSGDADRRPTHEDVLSAVHRQLTYLQASVRIPPASERQLLRDVRRVREAFFRDQQNPAEVTLTLAEATSVDSAKLIDALRQFSRVFCVRH